MWSRIVSMTPEVFDGIINHIRKQLVKETSYEKSSIN